MKKIIKLLVLSGVVLAAAGFIGWLVVRQVVIAGAEQKARTILEATLNDAERARADDRIIAVTTTVFENFKHQNPHEISLYRLRPYLTNQRLPSWFRLPEGVMEAQLGMGYCDNAARLLSFVLKQEGFQSVQLNMVSASAAHSALLVTTPDQQKILADPFYGYVAADQNRTLLSPQAAQEKLRAGENFHDVFLSLGANSTADFYSRFEKVSMAPQGGNLTLTSTLPPLNGKPLILGDINGSSVDVQEQGKQHALTAFWHYMGHKYNREWVRVLQVTEPVRVTVTLVQPVEKNVLNATPAPVIDDKTLVWNLQAGETLTFKDGDAKISLKRLNSYIDIDQIRFAPGL